MLVGKLDVPSDRLSTFANYMITLDNSWHARQLEKKSKQHMDNILRFRPKTHFPQKPQSSQNTQNPYSGNRSTTKDGHYPRAMELDGAQRGKKLTDAQRNYRRANNLCMYCGKSGHFASNCSTNPNKGRSNNPYRGKNDANKGSSGRPAPQRRFGNSASVKTTEKNSSSAPSRPLYSLVAEESKN